MKIEEQIFAYKELRKNGQAFFVDNYEDADRIIDALEKQIPKKPFMGCIPRDSAVNCGSCNSFIGFSDQTNRYNYCPKCGQKIDWKEVE